MPTTSLTYEYTVDHFAAVLSNGILLADPITTNMAIPAGAIEVDYNGTTPSTWTQVTDIVTNNSGADLNYLTLGVFELDANLNYTVINSGGSIPIAYTLIDQVSVTNLDNCSKYLQVCEEDTVILDFPNLPSTGYTYQWYDPNGSLISGATGTSINLGLVGLSDAGLYELVVSDGTSSFTLTYELDIFLCCDRSVDIKVPIGHNTSSYLINSLNGGNPIVSNRTVRINGNFEVDQKITFQNCTIYLGTDAKMNIDNFKTLYILESRVEPCDIYMFEGIIADAPSDSLHFIDSKILGGKTAIQSKNNGYLKIRFSSFEDNHIGIGVYDYQPTTFPYAPNLIGIDGNEFIHSGSNLIIPYQTQPYPYKCIDVANVNDLKIGGVEPNTFQDFQYGIYANTSEIEVFNAEFDQNATIVLSNPDPDHAAIYCVGPTGTLDYFEEASCTVTNTFDKVQFTDCQVAIFCREFYLSCNDARGIGNGYDIRMRDFDGADIWDNDFDGTNGTSVVSVSCQNATPRLLDVDIYGNEISSYRYGIQVFNVLGNGSNYETKVYNNDVDFTASLAAVFRQGITILGCTYSEVYNNSVEKTFGVSSSEATFLVGIRVEQTTNADIYENTIDEMGRAILGRDNLSGTQYWCNTMDGYYEGWFFDNATLSNQLISGGVQDNRWYNPAAPPRTDITGTATTNPTLYRSTGGAGLDPDQQVASGGPIFTEIVSVAQSPCSSGGGTQTLSGGGLTGSSTSSATLPNVVLPERDQEYNAILSAQTVLDSAESSGLPLVLSNTPEEQMGAMYYNLQNGNWNNLTSSALALSADTAKYYAETSKIVDAYVNYYAQRIDFPTSVRNDLLAIAYSGGIAEYGPNVLSAWVMLGMDGNSDIENKSVGFRNYDFEKVNVYPNPTSGRLVIESKDLFQAEDQEVNIEIMDIFGRKVYRNDVVFTGKAYGFYLNDMPAGVYQLNLQYNNTSEVHSIVIK
ncbi:T9SS type A sorting domain-containing protein [Cryomorphaceae bacterium]|nr:T9SS type A sorting domain-containing protein [Cryomorphaceae bacterium]